MSIATFRATFLQLQVMGFNSHSARWIIFRSFTTDAVAAHARHGRVPNPREVPNAKGWGCPCARAGALLLAGDGTGQAARPCSAVSGHGP